MSLTYNALISFIVLLAYILIFLSGAHGIATAMAVLASLPLPEKLVNLTYGNNSYLINNKAGNSGILLITNLDAKKSVDNLIGSGASSDNQGWQGIAVAISVAIIGAIAASWNFLQARLNGRHFQQLILEELGEIHPDRTVVTDGMLKSYMKKDFIHKKILEKETENKDLILTTNHKLIYHTKQLWSAFDNNDVKTFLRQLSWISVAKKRKILRERMKYDKKRGTIKKACNTWIELVMADEFQHKITEEKLDTPDKIITKWYADDNPKYIKDIFLKARKEVQNSVW
jgi:hypothetical protein